MILSFGADIYGGIGTKMTNGSTKQLNSNGNRRGMSPNSRKNLDIGRKGNNHAKADISVTCIQREMLGKVCPYAKDPTWTWAYALAEAGMRDALTEEKARENLKDRLEGKVTQPTSGEGTYTLIVKYDNDERADSPS